MKLARRSALLALLTISLAATSCTDDAPAPGGTPSSDSLVRAPNGTNMGAPPPNVGTPAP